MSTLNIHHLVISWSVSRGRDTCGYNICRLDDRKTGKRYRTIGVGYDMQGTVFGDWLTDVHQDKLKELFKNNTSEDCGYTVPGYRKIKDLYGLTLSPKGIASCDGACGIRSMINIAEAIGLEAQWEGNKKGHTTGYYVCEKTKEEEQK